MSDLHNILPAEIARDLDQAGYAVVPKVPSKDMLMAGMWDLYNRSGGGTLDSAFQAMLLAFVRRRD